MTIKLGWEPHRIKPIFSKGVDWIVSVEPEGDSPVWPEGATVTAVVYDKATDVSAPLDEWIVLYSWEGTIQDDVLTIRAESADTDMVPAGSLMRIRVSFPNTPNTDDYLFAKGVVARDD
ncbi:hypothetical protein PXH78_09340 [Mycolicibacterium smegmatis]|uniref:LtfC-like domain-containing protein n=1 Tax=Mycolicibacterium smegmatis TaxID=1772 RepID=UPI0005D7E3D2|nr:hypothetical protein [Mycolicibacterium smegmatis]MDF1899071.1 hypothetical protein [Mycolicibacterium smegmatis]MDF1904895.1 hypothetical protein [Mycolicibacterium smegmatis]MDF1918764.1 hypothetical protein [Mycolicibacterium smegmatis]MDF1924059.1 hypothetical protein [Mycolicibacterium smegmatis]UAK53345.1 hypothetical protein K8P01_22395 [Mycolicibacterium smegmatis]